MYSTRTYTSIYNYKIIIYISIRVIEQQSIIEH